MRNDRQRTLLGAGGNYHSRRQGIGGGIFVSSQGGGAGCQVAESRALQRRPAELMAYGAIC